MKKTINLKVALRTVLVALCFLSLPALTFGQKQTVTGTVVSAEDSNPLIGVSVITDDGTGTVTDVSGRYTLAVAKNGTLHFNYLGYKDVAENVAARTTVDIKMVADTKAIDEVVVLGYTSQKKAELSSSIVTLSGSVLNDVTTPDVGNMLQGKAAGVVVLNSSGQPGEGAQIRIRGTGSITAGADPLYVVDGVAGGSFNPNDVETLTILKDASATALYGASAAGGVIVITTKSAKDDQTTVNFKANVGIKRALQGRFSPMDSYELYYTQKDMYSNSGISSVFKTLRPKTLLDQDFDWVNACFKTGVVQDYYASATGKTGKTNYFVSVDHYDEEGSLINTNFVRNSARLNLSTAINDRLTLNVRVNYNSSKEQQASSYVTLECAYRALPWDNPYDANTGEILYVNGAVRSDNGETWYSHDKYNILHNEIYNYAKNNSEDAVADVQLVWNINDWLNFTTTNRFNTSNWFYEEYIDPRTKSPAYSNDGYIYNASGNSNGFGSTNVLKASKSFGGHNLNGIVGLEYGDGFYREMAASGNKMPAGQASLSNAIPLTNTGYNFPSRSWAWLAQAQYSYEGKYVATASVRYDETYKFAPKARGGYFPGVSAAWIASQEEFLKNNNTISFLKVRAGYGKTGNDNIEAFLYQDSYKLSSQYKQIVAAVLERQANPNLGWEEAYMASLGIDATIKNNVNVTLDLYNTLNTNLLLAVPRAPSTGFFEFMDNVGKVRNKGIELAVDGNIINNRNFTWNMGFNIGFNKNSVEYLPNGEFLQSTTSGPSQQVKVGQDIYSWYMPKWAGVDPANGDPLWEVVADDGTVSTTNIYQDATYQVVGTASPKFSGGLNTSIRYKSWTLSANGSFLYGNQIFNSARISMDSDGAYTDYNMMSIDNGLGWSRWEEAGDVATHPKVMVNGNKSAHAISSRYLEDGSFFRLRNVTLSYTMPAKMAEKLSMKGARIFVSADNILTLSRFSGMDPEVRLEGSAWELAGTYSTNYPVPMSVTAGIDIKF
ncbi:MAG: SusC/RagA family TonB-linked outer membrane protein [Tidjanibacter sp.]|nr:SusC/RagA family TonB-linked outer membrane protein [Tidjanibacter sp.]